MISKVTILMEISIQIYATSPNVQESRKSSENKNKRLFILGDSIVKFISGFDISLQIEL